MGKFKENYYWLMRLLDEEFLRLHEEHQRLSPRNGEVPVGGAHMDSFFRIEAIREFTKNLREGKTLEQAVTNGITAGKEAILRWNKSKKDYQVHRWELGPGEWLRDKIRQHMQMRVSREVTVINDIT